MRNGDQFRTLVTEILEKNSTYKNEIGNFLNYLKDRLLEDKVFNLNQNHIDDYFVYSYDTKIGAVPTLTTHISALKFLFDELIKRQYDFKLLYAYIDTAGFKEKLSENLEKSFKKPIIDNTLLTSTLYKIDTHIMNNINSDFRNPTEQKRFFEIMIARLYAKLSLILPLKTSEMLELKFNNIQDGSTRSIEYNEIVIKLPNNIRNQIVETLDYARRVFNKIYSENDRLFYFLYGVLNRKINTSCVSTSFIKTYTELGIFEMLKQQPGGKKDKYVYPPESYKVTAILSMLNNGTNIVYLKKLTGLDTNALLSNYDTDKEFQNKVVASININNGIVNSEYYTYL
ncbi:hypothetical protein IAI10_23095 [Clostridium sp. 19966]|uniref:hypothetical protein n=1 Tax=Clostridium sp. 19966 TaxID=2768166 RepID=UPI0028DFC154|nr:hypothetical protein [Clostridium sp. 19966]MDT8719536.1 hypothetical protein [Clostridium sp. 19966]